ncbi:serine dehydratase [Okeanomitos corallinicola TIOX110]|uniref:Serine dehydratase n=1 Tax=Okeanomitos corallinicola TIOX110 TaxID=3133117 RepID=A0ABZ2UWR8_9CYAN
MSLINHQSQKSQQLSNDKQSSNQHQPSIYTLEDLIQTLEEAANYLAFR